VSRRPSRPDGVVYLHREGEAMPHLVDGFRTPEPILAPGQLQPIPIG
jgi:hypothetical protein